MLAYVLAGTAEGIEHRLVSRLVRDYLGKQWSRTVKCKSNLYLISFYVKRLNSLRIINKNKSLNEKKIFSTLCKIFCGAFEQAYNPDIIGEMCYYATSCGS